MLVSLFIHLKPFQRLLLRRQWPNSPDDYQDCSIPARLFQIDISDGQRDIDPFDIVFLDPPFKANLMFDCFQLLESNNMIADNGSIYIETETEFKEEILPESWRLSHKNQAGKVFYYLYKKINKKG